MLPISEVQYWAVCWSELQWVAVCLSLLKYVAINFLLPYADFHSCFQDQGWGDCGGMVSWCMARLRMEVINERERKSESVRIRDCCQIARIRTHAHMNAWCHSNRQDVSYSIICESHFLRTNLFHGTIEMNHFGCMSCQIYICIMSRSFMRLSCICEVPFIYEGCRTQTALTSHPNNVTLIF